MSTSTESLGRTLHTLSRLSSKWHEKLHHCYVVLALVGIVTSLFFSPTVREVLLLALLGVYLIVFSVFSLASSYINGEKAKYAEALPVLHDAIHRARDIYHRIDCELADERTLYGTCGYSEREFQSDVQKILTVTAQVFSMVSSVKCRTSIKLLGQKPDASSDSLDAYYVTTLARDQASETESRERDKAEGTRHLVRDNTDFWTIIRRQRSYFLNDGLSNSDNYENSSFKLHPNLPKYESTIVWPIRYVYDAHTAGEHEEEPLRQDVCGFLTVDSRSKGSFSERYDVQLGAIISDGLYPVFDAYRAQRQKRTQALQDTVQQGVRNV